MAILGRKTLKSERARTRRIDQLFERAAKFILVIFSIFVASSWLSYRESIRIDDVIVEGAVATDRVVAETISKQVLSEKILWKIDRNNSLLLPNRSIRNGILKADSRIQSVALAVRERKVLVVTITEFTPTFLWCPTTVVSSTTSDALYCFLADAKGYIFSSAPTYSGYPFDVYRTNIPGREEQGTPIGLNMLPEEEYQKVATFHSLLTAAGIVAHEITEGDPTDYRFRVEGNWDVIWSSRSEPKKSIENLQLVLNEIKKERGVNATVSSIDLRFGSKVFYVDGETK